MRRHRLPRLDPLATAPALDGSWAGSYYCPAAEAPAATSARTYAIYCRDFSLILLYVLHPYTSNPDTALCLILLWVILILATLNAHLISGGALRLRLFLFIFIIFLKQLENHPGSDSRLRPLPDVAGGFDNPVQPLPKRRWIRSLATSHFPMSDPNPARPIPQPLSKPRTRAPVD